MPLGGINQEHTSTISFKIKKGDKGFGFTVADSTDGQQVKQVVESDRLVIAAESNHVTLVHLGAVVSNLTT